MYTRVHKDFTFVNLFCRKTLLRSAFRIIYNRVPNKIYSIQYNDSLLYENVRSTGAF